MWWVSPRVLQAVAGLWGFPINVSGVAKYGVATELIVIGTQTWLVAGIFDPSTCRLIWTCGSHGMVKRGRPPHQAKEREEEMVARQ